MKKHEAAINALESIKRKWQDFANFPPGKEHPDVIAHYVELVKNFQESIDVLKKDA